MTPEQQKANREQYVADMAGAVVECFSLLDQAERVQLFCKLSHMWCPICGVDLNPGEPCYHMREE